jgi:hypothetical protein
MEDGGDKLNNLADTVYEEEENRTREEVIELSEEVLYNRGNVQNMTQMLLTAEDSDILGRAQLALDGSNEASRSLDSTKGWNSCHGFRGWEHHWMPASAQEHKKQD